MAELHVLEDTGPDQSERTPFQDHDADYPRKPAAIPFPACRHILVVLAFLGMAITYTQRVVLSVAVVNMVVDSARQTSGNDSTTITPSECAIDGQMDNATHPPSAGEFHWTKEQQGIILGSFYYGYLSSQIPGGMLAERFGGKHVLGTGVLAMSVLTILTPVAARTSYVLFVVLRILEGIVGGVVYPSVMVLQSHWAPPLERTKLSTFIYAGADMGSLAAMAIGGILSDTLGWTSGFYVFGSLGCLWWVCWLFLVYDTPKRHPRISAAERDYIEAMLPSNRSRKKMATPWLSIWSSLPFWAMVVAHVASNWGYYTLLTCLPQFMNDILHFDLSSNGALSALFPLTSWLMANAAAQLADLLRSKHIVQTVVVRKVFTCAGLIGPALFLILSGQVGCNRGVVVAMIVTAGGLAGLLNAGMLVNALDIAPRFAGTLMGISNTAATLPGMLAPSVVATLTEHKNTRKQWQTIFYIAGAIYTVGAIVYGVFAAGEEQEWAKVSRSVNEELQVNIAADHGDGPKNEEKKDLTM